MVKYGGTAVLSDDVRAAMAFYRDVMELELLMDNGEHALFKCGVAVWNRSMAQGLIFGKVSDDRAALFELFFESDGIQADYDRISKSAKVVNPLAEQPWGQLTFRITDPDGHLIEVGEKLSETIRRFRAQGMTDDEISARTHTPKELLDSL